MSQTFRTTLFTFTAASLCLLAMPASAKMATGDTVSDISVTDSNGQVHNLSDYAGKTIVLEWTNHKCPYVKKHYNTKFEGGNMQNLQKAATEDDVVWLSVISSAPGKQGHVSGDKANALTEARGAAPSAVILDETGAAGRAFSAKTTPHMFVINADQTLVYQGAIDDNRSSSPKTIAGAQNYVRDALAAIAAGEPVKTGETAPYGCSVKYGS